MGRIPRFNVGSPSCLPLPHGLKSRSSFLAVPGEPIDASSLTEFHPARSPPRGGRTAGLTDAELRGEGLARQQHGVDDVDHAVRLKHVLNGDLGGVAFAVPHPDGAILHLEGKLSAFHGLERRLAATPLDHLREVTSGDATWNNMVGQDLGELALILGLEQRVDDAGRQLGESLVGRREHREGAFAEQRVDEVGGLHGGDEGRVVLRVDD
jgi:hypothetical protein